MGAQTQLTKNRESVTVINPYTVWWLALPSFYQGTGFTLNHAHVHRNDRTCGRPESKQLFASSDYSHSLKLEHATTYG